MSVKTYDKTNDKLNLVAGGTLYADSPIGSIIPYGGATAPDGFLLCQGQAVSRTTYAELFAIIGTNFGEGDGTTTFNVPKYTQLKQDYTVKTQLDTWRNSLEDGSESHTFTIDKDGSYYFEVVLSNATGGKQSNNITITGNNNLVCSWGFVGANAILQNKTIFLKAGTYVVTHLCETAGIGGTAVVTVYSTRNVPVGSYIIKAKQVGVPADMQSDIQDTVLDIMNTVTSGTGTLNATYTTSGDVKWHKVGRVVVVKISYLAIKAITQDQAVVHGLPPAIVSTYATLVSPTDNGFHRLVTVNDYGDLVSNGGAHDAITDMYGEIVYISKN